MKSTRASPIFQLRWNRCEL